jgi:hypothetical protein
MSEQASSEQTSSSSDAVAQETAQRVSYLDVVEQQLEAMRAQAQATIASCDSALTTVRLLQTQMINARKLADERRLQETTQAQKPPSTFGRHRRAQES